VFPVGFLGPDDLGTHRYRVGLWFTSDETGRETLYGVWNGFLTSRVSVTLEIWPASRTSRQAGPLVGPHHPDADALNL